MIRNFLLLSPFLLSSTCTQKREVTYIFLIGDSTMANKSIFEKPETVWGEVLPEFFDASVAIHNHAKNGRSTKSFIHQGLWQKVYDSLRTRDYVMIQFGQNDQKFADTTRYAAPYGAYKTNLQRYVTETRRKGALPILITPADASWV